MVIFLSSVAVVYRVSDIGEKPRDSSRSFGWIGYFQVVHVRLERTKDVLCHSGIRFSTMTTIPSSAMTTGYKPSS
jgi:hypothetical protein